MPIDFPTFRSSTFETSQAFAFRFPARQQFCHKRHPLLMRASLVPHQQRISPGSPGYGCFITRRRWPTPWRAVVVQALQAWHQDGPVEKQIIREKISFITAEGIVTIPGREIAVPKVPKIIQPMPTYEEQGLCIGATFSLAATNGRDFDRRINILGFCQSIDVLNEAVEETVMSRGGEVLEQERKVKSEVHEQLKMIVCIPFLWGVPPELDALSEAIAAAGGIVDRVYKQWGIYRPQFVRVVQEQYPLQNRRDNNRDIWC